MKRYTPSLFPALVLAALTACSGGDNYGSDSRTVALRDYTCKDCRIVADSIAYIGHPDDTVAVTQFSLPAADKQGRFYLPTSDGDRVQVFNSSGRLVQTIGKPGQGPGEFEAVFVAVPAANDSLLVFSFKTVHVMAPDFKHVRQFTLGDDGFMGGVPQLLSDGSILLSVFPNSFMRMGPTGDTLSKVKLTGIDTTRKCPECARRSFAESRTAGSLWSSTQDAYIVDLHSLDGTLQRRFVRQADWFKPWAITANAGGHSEGVMMVEEGNFAAMFAKPRLLGVREDDGLLWTFVMIVEDMDALLKMPPIDDPEKMSALYEKLSLRVEAIDIASGKLLAGTTFRNIGSPIGQGLTALMQTDPSGDAMWKIVRLRVEGR